MEEKCGLTGQWVEHGGECTQSNRFRTRKIQFFWQSPPWPQKEPLLRPDQALTQCTWECRSQGNWFSLAVGTCALSSLPSPGYPCGPSHIYDFPVSASQGNFILSFKWTLSCIRVRKLYPSLSSLCAERKPGNVMLWAKSSINAAAHEKHMKAACSYPDCPWLCPTGVSISPQQKALHSKLRLLIVVGGAIVRNPQSYRGNCLS